MAYLAPFYLTIFLHVTPIKHSGKILDIFMLVEYEVVDHLLIGLLTSLRKRILDMPSEDDIILFFRDQLMEECLEHDNIGSFLMTDSLEDILKRTADQ